MAESKAASLPELKAESEGRKIHLRVAGEHAATDPVVTTAAATNTAGPSRRAPKPGESPADHKVSVENVSVEMTDLKVAPSTLGQQVIISFKSRRGSVTGSVKSRRGSKSVTPAHSPRAVASSRSPRSPFSSRPSPFRKALSRRRVDFKSRSPKGTPSGAAGRRRRKSVVSAISRLAKLGMSTPMLFKDVEADENQEEEEEEMADEMDIGMLHLLVRWIVPIICIAFFVTKTFQPILLQWNRVNGSYPFAPTSSIWVSRIVLMLFFGIWCWSDGEKFTDKKEWKQSLPFLLVSAMTIGNVLSIYLTVQMLGAGTYAVLKNLNLVLTAVLVRFWLGKIVSDAQWACVIIITLGTFIFRISVFSTGSVNHGYFFVLMGVVCSTFEGLILQIVTHRLPNMSFQKQSFYYHFYSTILALVLMLTYDYKIVFYESGGPFHGWNYKVVVYLLCVVPLVSMKHAVAGLVSAIMVKLIVAGTTVSTYLFAILVFSTSATAVQYLAAIIICVAIVAYNLEGHRIAAEMELRLQLRQGVLEESDKSDSCKVHCAKCATVVVEFPKTLQH